MTRIYENIPVRSLLYVMGGFEFVRILDFENEYELSKGTDSTKYKVLYNGQVKDSHGLSNLVDYATIHRVDSVGGVTRISICTRYEEYGNKVLF